MITGNVVRPLGNCEKRFDEKPICLALGVMFLAVSFISTFFLALAIPANAQEGSKTARIGILRVDALKSPAAAEAIQDLKQGLSNLGYVEGQNVNFDIRWADNRLDHLADLANERASSGRGACARSDSSVLGDTGCGGFRQSIRRTK